MTNSKKNAILASVANGGAIPEMEKTVKLLETSIEIALADYFRYVENSEYTEEDFTPEFIHKLAVDSYYSKNALREMFRKSPAWNETLQCLVINGNRTHEPDLKYIDNVARIILKPAYENAKTADEKANIIFARLWFTDPTEEYEKALLNLAPKANLRKSKSKIFGALCKALGIWEDNGEFQRKFSDLCNEFNQKKIKEKIYVSINPAHFLTMSNPHNYRKGNSRPAMVSCHSLDSDYSYKAGCIGYARDETSIIAFTASDDKDPETLNNRKTDRLIFGYKPGNNGVLLQSRLYTTCRNDSYGGVKGDEGNETCKLFRNLLQREIAECENFPNFWAKPEKYCDSEIVISTGIGFSGYADWVHFDDIAVISLTKYEHHAHKGFSMGAAAICIECGEEFHNNERSEDALRCDLCKAKNENEKRTCEECGEFHRAENLHLVYDISGNEIEVCEDCLSRYYFYCEDCGNWHHTDNSCYVGGDFNGRTICQDCFNDGDYTLCDYCECDYPADEMTTARDSEGNEIHICECCKHEYYEKCEECGEYYQSEDINVDGFCPQCAEHSEHIPA